MSDKRPTVVNSRDAKILAEARVEFLRGQVLPAVRKYESLVRNYPNHGPVVAELAQIYLRIGREREAEPLLVELLQATRPSVNDLRVAASGFRKMGRHRQAMVALELLVKLPMSTEQSLSFTIELAELAEKNNELEVAQSAVRWLSERGASTFSFPYLAGKLAFRQGRWDAALAHLNHAFEHPTLSMEQRCRVHYAVGKVLDRLGRFDEAFENFTAAKAIERSRAGQERLKAAWMSDLITRVTDELRVRRPADSRKSENFGRPLCFLTGHPRSGTTLLEQMLAAHPAVATADENSAMFQRLVTPLVFPASGPAVAADSLALPALSLRDLQVDGVESTRLRDAVAQYRAHLEWVASDGNPENYLIDKSPAGLIDLPMIESILPETRVVVLLRDPRDVCLSCFQEDFGLNPVSVNFDSLESTAKKIVRDLEFWFAFRATTGLRWLEVHYERLVTDPESELRRICQFLNLDWNPAMLTFQEALGQRSIQSPTYAQVVEPISNRAIGRWKNYRAGFQVAEQVLSDMCQRLGYMRDGAC